MSVKKLSKEIAKEIANKIKSKDFQETLKAIKSNKEAAETNGTFKVIISTDYRDRSGEIIDQEGWELEHFKNNPVVLWAHDYSKLPIGMATKVFKNNDGQLEAEGIFASHEFAQEVRKLYDEKIVRATSVGFIAKEMQGNTITNSELIEFSFVPVPCNPEALGKMKKINMNVAELATKGFIKLKDLRVKRVVPEHNPQRADIGMEWDGTAAIDRMRKLFSTDGSGTKDQMEWDNYIDGFTWHNEVETNDFTSYKLPHHDVVDGNFMTVFNGVVAAMEALNGERGGVEVPEDDRQKVWEHLADHYRQFDQEPPVLKTMEEVEAKKAAEKRITVFKKFKGNDYFTVEYSDNSKYKLHERNVNKEADIAILKEIDAFFKKAIKQTEKPESSEKTTKKGAVEDEMTVDMEDRSEKWNNLDKMDTILWAFYDIYFLNTVKADEFPVLISEVADLFKALATSEKSIDENGAVARSIYLEKTLKKHGTEKGNCKYTRLLKTVSNKAATEEEIGAIMTQLQADVDNLLIVASRELQSLAGEENEEKKVEKIKNLINLFKKEIRAVDKKGGSESQSDHEGKKSSEKKETNKKVVKKSVSKETGLDAYVVSRDVLRVVDNVINKSLEAFNKKIKGKNNK